MSSKTMSLAFPALLLLLFLPSQGAAGQETECLLEEYKGEYSGRPGVAILEIRGSAFRSFVKSDVATSGECYDLCCEQAIYDNCDTSSYYQTSNGSVCYGLKCGSPFSQCEWAETENEVDKAGYITVVRGQITPEQEVTLANLQWNIPGPSDTTDTTGSEHATTESETPLTTAAAPTDGFQAPAEVDTSVANQPFPQNPDSNNAFQSAPGPAAQPAAQPAPQPALPAGEYPPAQASNALADIDNKDQLNAIPDDKFSDNGESFASAAGDMSFSDADDDDYRINLPVLFICLAAALGLVLIGGVFIFRRISAERDRTVYRPLMDDLRSHGYGETEPLH